MQLNQSHTRTHHAILLMQTLYKHKCLDAPNAENRISDMQYCTVLGAKLFLDLSLLGAKKTKTRSPHRPRLDDDGEPMAWSASIVCILNLHTTKNTTRRSLRLSAYFCIRQTPPLALSAFPVHLLLTTIHHDCY